MIKTIRKKNPRVQLLLFSATFNERVKAFALKIAPTANQVFIPKEELSLDVIKQYNVKWVDRLELRTHMLRPGCLPAPRSCPAAGLPLTEQSGPQPQCADPAR